jgi:hypothetical protein
MSYEISKYRKGWSSKTESQKAVIREGSTGIFFCTIYKIQPDKSSSCWARLSEVGQGKNKDKRSQIPYKRGKGRASKKKTLKKG